MNWEQLTSLAARWVAAYEKYVETASVYMIAQAKLADSHRERNDTLTTLDRRWDARDELRSHELDKIARHMGGTLEHLGRIDARLAGPPNGPASGGAK